MLEWLDFWVLGPAFSWGSAGDWCTGILFSWRRKECTSGCLVENSGSVCSSYCSTVKREVRWWGAPRCGCVTLYRNLFCWQEANARTMYSLAVGMLSQRSISSEVMSLPSQIAPVFFQLCCKAGCLPSARLLVGWCKAGLAAEGMGNSTFHKLAGIRRKAIGKFPFGIWLSGLSVPASQAVIVHKKSSPC